MRDGDREEHRRNMLSHLGLCACNENMAVIDTEQEFQRFAAAQDPAEYR